MVELEALTVGHSVDTAPADAGRVHSVFTRTVNLEIRGELWSLLTAERPDLPFGIRVRSSTFEHLCLRRGEPMHTRTGFLGIGSRIVIDCRAAPLWRPVCDYQSSAGLEERMDAMEVLAARRAWPGSAAMADAVLVGLRNRGRLGTALANVIGCGPGSTPAGDDVLIGILAILKSPHSGLAGAQAAASLCRELLPLIPHTAEISGHLLRQAANGLFSRPVHELLRALISGTPLDALIDVTRRVVETGATSGADLCTGLLACARSGLGGNEPRLAA